MPKPKGLDSIQVLRGRPALVTFHHACPAARENGGGPALLNCDRAISVWFSDAWPERSKNRWLNRLDPRALAGRASSFDALHSEPARM